MKRHSNAAWWYVAPALAILGFVGLIPLLSVVNYSFFDIFTLESRFWVGTEWFDELVGSADLYVTLGRSLLFSGLALLIQFPLGLLIALNIPKNGLGRSILLIVLALPLLVPWNMIPGMWLGLIDPELGLLGRIIAGTGITFDYKFNAVHTWLLLLAMDTWHWVGLVAILAYSGLSSIPAPYFQAARIDGARRWAVFRFIQLPRLRGVLTMALVLRIMDSLMIYTEAFGINAGGPGKATSFLALELGEDIAAFNYGPAAARSVLYFLIVLLVAWTMTATLRRHGGTNG
ncbi:carbohydrate ABC transporter permease [Jannaschia sp. 2305UL9-9]|uniref:carbohydrate ABC transporter permease n=1 Tax=Jannaschia sp. 2305UL9-9 TaxID=3121638 RepID=UPI003528A0D9